MAETTPPSPKSGHPRAVVALLIVATLLTVVGIFSIWINRQALNTDNWVNTSTKLLQNKDIQGQLAIYLSDQLFANVNVEEELQKALPPKLAPLAGPASGALEQLAPQAAEKALERPKVQELWESANRAAHEALLKVINGGGPAVSTGGGEVTLNLGTLLGQIGEKLGVGGKIAEKIPPEAGQITVLKSSQLSTVQSVAKLIRRLPVVLTLLVILLYGFAIYLAGPRRRETLRSVGICFLIAGVVTLILRGFVGNEVVDALAKSESVKPATEAVWSIGTSLLATVATSAIAIGILLVVAAWLVGPTRFAVRFRREAAPYVEEHRAGAYAVAGLVFLALIAWAPIPALGTALGIILFAVLFALGTEFLCRQILRESSDRGAAETDGQTTAAET
ncbi:MAG TPA: hypothetical protein VHM66_04375 [Solirubrobacterales bacterium]|nr:hypothetical protein [Solirubrobacterales bacterium]